jgi:hypothetical protein
MALAPEQIAQIKREFSGEISVFAIARGVLRDREYAAIEAGIRTAMQSEGKVLDERPGVANLWGGEFADRVREALKVELAGRMTAMKATIVTAACPNFCKLKRDGTLDSEGWTVAIAIADALASVATGIPLPLTTISVYIVKSRMLNVWCDCSAFPTP